MCHLSLEKIYTENIDYLRNLCRYKVGYNDLYDDLIEDCLQETFEIAVREYETLKTHPQIRGWLTRTCLNRLIPAVQQFRSHKKREAFSLDSTEHGEVEGSNSIEEYVQVAAYNSFLKQLQAVFTSEEHMVFQFYFIEGYTMAQIAAKGGISENKVKVIIRHIRKKAKKIETNFML